MRRRTIHWITATVLIVLSLSLTWSLGTAASRESSANAGSSINALQINPQDTTAFTRIYQAVSPSVVAIRVTVAGRNGRPIATGTGSGFVMDGEGHIITNEHVVDGATFIEVEFYDGTLAEGRIVGLNADSDIAVLDVDLPASKLFPVQFGDSGMLAVGEAVLAIGSPFGQDWTLTTGIVSGLDRIIDGLANYSIGGVIQTDAAINPGNSGGPLLNMNGQVIGVNAQIATASGSSSGVGFAIPGNLVQRVARELIQDGSVDYSYIGISGTDVTLSLIQTLRLPAETRGVIVSQVVANGPAARAGLRSTNVTAQTTALGPGANMDVITAIDGTAIKGMDDLVSYLALNTVPGQTIMLSVLRNGAEAITLPVTLTSRP